MFSGVYSLSLKQTFTQRCQMHIHEHKHTGIYHHALSMTKKVKCTIKQILRAFLQDATITCYKNII